MLAWWSMRVGPGDLTINGTGPGRHRPALKKGLEAQTLCCLSWSCGCQSLEDPSSSQLPEHLNCPSIHKAHRQGKIGSIFFFFPLFAFQLIEQMEILFLNYPMSPFGLSTSGRRLFGCICFLKMRMRTGVEWGEAFYLFFPPACPINIVSQDKQRNKLIQH